MTGPSNPFTSPSACWSSVHEPDWHPLDVELNHWRAESLPLPLWWRDDDAIAPTPQLDRLSELADKLGLPVHLAVIPRDATPELAEYVAARASLVPVVHGWAHTNHAPRGEKKAEFRLDRPLDVMASDAQAGMARLRSLFGDNMRQMFVPPWNRIAPEMVQTVAKAGIPHPVHRNAAQITSGRTGA